MLLRSVRRDHPIDDFVVAALAYGMEYELALGLVELVRQLVDTLLEGAAHGVPELDRCLSTSR